MTELEKLDAGLEYDFWDEGVDGRKLHALEWCQKLNAIPMEKTEERTKVLRTLFGAVGENATVLPVFNCDNGNNIYVGKNFIANYNVTILDIAPGSDWRLCNDRPWHIDYNGESPALTPWPAQTSGYCKACQHWK